MGFCYLFTCSYCYHTVLVCVYYRKYYFICSFVEGGIFPKNIVVIFSFNSRYFTLGNISNPWPTIKTFRAHDPIWNNSNLILLYSETKCIFFGWSEILYHQYFNVYRSERLLDYIPSTHVLSHSHNLFLDFFMRFWLIGIIWCVWGLILSFKWAISKMHFSKLITPINLYLTIPFIIMASIHHIELSVWLFFLLFLRYFSFKTWL